MRDPTVGAAASEESQRHALLSAELSAAQTELTAARAAILVLERSAEHASRAEAERTAAVASLEEQLRQQAVQMRAEVRLELWCG